MTEQKPAPTLETVWALFQEVGEQIKELSASSMASAKDTEARFKDTEARFKDLEARFKDAEAMVKELSASSRASAKDAEAQFKATDARIDKAARTVDRLAGNIGGLSKKWGDLGEAMTVGEAMPIFNAIEGIAVNSLSPNVLIDCGDKELEIDALAIGKDVVIVMEAKATLKRDDVINFVNKRLKVFTKLVPIYEGKRIYGAMGFLSAHSGVQEYAQAQGLLLIRPHGTNKELVPLPENFKLRNFHP